LQISKQLPDGRRIWRIPVMDGEFVCDDRFGTLKGVAGGNLILIGRDPAKTLAAAEHAVEAMRAIPGVIAPFPGGVVRSGSKVGSRYKMLRASTNTAFTPTTRGLRPSLLPQDANCAYEIVIDGLTLDGVERATAAGIHAAADPRWELLAISAGNYGGKLGPYHIQLHDVIRRYPMPNATITRPLEG
jgi:formylmethanofuran--tetrahydromethanopterin N-formyltransferase